MQSIYFKLFIMLLYQLVYLLCGSYRLNFIWSSFDVLNVSLATAAGDNLSCEWRATVHFSHVVTTWAVTLNMKNENEQIDVSQMRSSKSQQSALWCNKQCVVQVVSRDIQYIVMAGKRCVQGPARSTLLHIAFKMYHCCCWYSPQYVCEGYTWFMYRYISGW